MRNGLTKLSVTVGDGVAVIRRELSSAVIVAGVLGRDSSAGFDTLYLDRLVHDDFQDWGEWTAFGAISTILSRPIPTTAPAAN
jgi:hypothetical protein